MKEVDEMNKGDQNRVKSELRELFISGRGRMVAFDFTQDKQNLDRAGLLQNDTQTSLVRNLKNDIVIMACCDSSDCNPNSHWGCVTLSK